MTRARRAAARPHGLPRMQQPLATRYYLACTPRRHGVRQWMRCAKRRRSAALPRVAWPQREQQAAAPPPSKAERQRTQEAPLFQQQCGRPGLRVRSRRIRKRRSQSRRLPTPPPIPSPWRLLGLRNRYYSHNDSPMRQALCDTHKTGDREAVTFAVAEAAAGTASRDSANIFTKTRLRDKRCLRSAQGRR